MKKVSEQSANVSTNVETKNVSLVRKFIGLNYETLNASEKKKFREKRRKQLFQIIDNYILAKQGKKANFDKKANFEEFKQFVTNNYNIPLSDCESVFNGQSENVRKQYFAMYIQDFKMYLSGKLK
jgi:hypothetical protein